MVIPHYEDIGGCLLVDPLSVGLSAESLGLKAFDFRERKGCYRFINAANPMLINPFMLSLKFGFHGNALHCLDIHTLKRYNAFNSSGVNGDILFQARLYPGESQTKLQILHNNGNFRCQFVTAHIGRKL